VFKRYLKAQFMVLLCGGLVGPIFLIVYFALGSMATPQLQWMFWAGLFVTAADVLAALALANHGAKSAARHEFLTRSGVLATARVTGISDTPVFVNDQQMIRIDLRIEPPGQPAFTDQKTLVSSPARMQTLTGHRLVVLVEPGTQDYEIDWNASALVAGVIPAEFTIEEDHTTYDLTGRAGPLIDILQVLHDHGIPLSGGVDIRSNPAVRQQVSDIVRRAGTAPVPAAFPDPAQASLPLTVSERLQQLDILRATGAITDAEYAAKRQDILADL
jgi:hypothetical protein